MFQVIQIAYWLSLATWFGGVLFIAIAAPIIFRTVADADPTLPKVLSVNLEGQHSTLLAGTIIAEIINTLIRVELLCAAVMALSIFGQWFFVSLNGPDLFLPILRSALFIGAAVLTIYDRRVLWPRVMTARQHYIDHADEPDVANPAKDQFDRYQQDGIRLLMIVLSMLLALVLFSVDIRGGRVTTLRAPAPQSDHP